MILSRSSIPLFQRLLFVAVLSLADSFVVAQTAGTKKPNIIFVLLDDLRFDGMGFINPQVKTPTIDRMAAGGVYLPNAVVTTSLCSPSRAAILTGQSTGNHRIVDNNPNSVAGLRYFPELLQAAGYETGFFGKWHMGEPHDRPRPGFDRWVSFKGQGHYFPVPNAGGGTNTLNVDGESVPQRGYITDELTDYAINWLRHREEPQRPFFLYLSHKAVHSEAVPAQRHVDT